MTLWFSPLENKIHIFVPLCNIFVPPCKYKYYNSRKQLAPVSHFIRLVWVVVWVASHHRVLEEHIPVSAIKWSEVYFCLVLTIGFTNSTCLCLWNVFCHWKVSHTASVSSVFSQILSVRYLPWPENIAMFQRITSRVQVLVAMMMIMKMKMMMMVTIIIINNNNKTIIMTMNDDDDGNTNDNNKNN